MAEAEGESEEGKRLVIDVILNRYDSPRFPNTISEVIYAKNAFECMWNGRVDRCHVRDDIRQLVIEELQFRTNSNIHYCRTNHYHGFGTPVIQVGNHYFSTY
jgi:N-acetylmuramoyl-L-alanine amidase